MSRIEIIKEFVSYCIDTKLNTKQKTSKNKFINAHMLNHAEYYGIKNFENTKKQIENILKYNPLTIEKMKQEKIKDLQQLPF